MFQQPDHWQNQPYDRNVATRYERFPKCGDNGKRAEAASNSSGEARDGDD